MTRTRFKGAGAAAVLLSAVALALAGCSTPEPAATEPAADGDWDAVLAAAEEEDGPLVITLITNQQEQDLMVAGFKEAYPDIDVQVVFRTAAELPTAIDAEVSSGSITTDVVYDSLAAWHVFERDVDEETTIFDTLWGPEIDAARERDEEIFHYGDRTVSPAGTLLGFAWRDDAVESAPDSMLDIVEDPAAKGRIGTYDITTNPTNIATLTSFEETLEDDFVEQLGASGPRFYVGAGPIVQAVGSGEVDYGIPAVWATVAATPGVEFGLNETPVEIPKQMSILKGAPHPNKALIFINWAVSEEGQSVLNSLQTPEGAFEGETYVQWAEIYDQDLIDENTARFREYFGV